jgi:PAP2 superfamily
MRCAKDQKSALRRPWRALRERRLTVHSKRVATMEVRTSKAIKVSPDFAAIETQHQATWASADFANIGRTLRSGGEQHTKKMHDFNVSLDVVGAATCNRIEALDATSAAKKHRCAQAPKASLTRSANRKLGNAIRIVVICAMAQWASAAQADIVDDWNIKAHEFIAEAFPVTPPAVRAAALVQTAVHEALESIARADSTVIASDASAHAAVGAATRAVLFKLIPAKQPAIDAAYRAMLSKQPLDAASVAAGASMGERAAATVLASRADDIIAPDTLRPHTSPGAWVPTTFGAASSWRQRKPWFIDNAAQFRPAPPPALTSAKWALEYNEVKSLGRVNSTARTPAQTEIATFWEYSLPSIYFGIVRSVTKQPGRTIAQNAKLYARVSQAMDDGLIALFDAKYHYNFWRPVTAIRNGDIDGNDTTEKDAAWAPFIVTPMHPEYPSGHAILAAITATVLRAEVGNQSNIDFSTTSDSAKGATRKWSSLDDFVQEVGDARVYEGVHFRSASVASVEMGRAIGKLAIERAPLPKAQ